MKYSESVDMADSDMSILKHALSFPKHYKKLCLSLTYDAAISLLCLWNRHIEWN